MARKSLGEEMMDGVKAICFYLPLWAVPVPALLIAAGWYWGTHRVLKSFGDFTHADSSNLPFVIGLVAFGLCFLAGMVGWSERRKRKALLAQTQSLDKLRELSWRDFEKMVGEAFRKNGYRVSEGTGRSPDGGIDLDTWSPSGERVLIQCKHWKKAKIGVPIVREMLGVLTREKADKVIISGTGAFTKEAIRWAEGQPIELIDGPALLKRLSGVDQTSVESPLPPKSTVPGDLPKHPQPITSAEGESCPKCGKDLVLRTARRGANAGNQFWGCSGYPGCRFTKPVE